MKTFKNLSKTFINVVETFKHLVKPRKHSFPGLFFLRGGGGVLPIMEYLLAKIQRYNDTKIRSEPLGRGEGGGLDPYH